MYDVLITLSLLSITFLLMFAMTVTTGQNSGKPIGGTLSQQCSICEEQDSTLTKNGMTVCEPCSDNAFPND